MITSMVVTSKARTPVGWWPKAFPNGLKLSFKSGVNVLWGPNGSGKSTVLTLLARLHCCEQLGVGKVTQHALHTLRYNFDTPLPTGIKVAHDGQEVRYFSPERVVGRDQGGGFDWDAGGIAALSAVLTKGSTGQLNLHRFKSVLAPKRESKVPWDDTAESMLKHKATGKDSWHALAAWTAKYLSGSIKKGQPTLLLDEPDAGLDWPHKAELWQFVTDHAKHAQWIVASHSAFAMHRPGANYIELKPGYLAECRAALHQLKETAQ